MPARQNVALIRQQLRTPSTLRLVVSFPHAISTPRVRGWGSLLPLLLIASCAPGPTAGRRVVISTRVTSDVAPNTSFANAFDWDIELDMAQVALEHLYYVTGAPVGPQSWMRSLLLREAHAHPGHYDAGDVVAEMPRPVNIDLLAPATDVGAAEGITAIARSAVVTFGTLADPGVEVDAGAEDLDGATVVVSGSATSGEDRVHFRGVLRPGDLLNPTSDLPEVAGCPFEGTVDGDGTVTAQVRVSTWLDQVDFSLLLPNEEERLLLEPGGEPHNAFLRGVKKAIAYDFRFEAKETQ